VQALIGISGRKARVGGLLSRNTFDAQELSNQNASL